MIRGKARECLDGLMVVSLKEIGKMIIEKAKGFLNMRFELNSFVFGSLRLININCRFAS